MPLLLRDIPLDLSVDEGMLRDEVARIVGIEVHRIKDLKVVRRSIDARKKSRVRRIFTVEFSCDNEPRLLSESACAGLEEAPVIPGIILPRVTTRHHVLIVGMGPAGLFAAKSLVESGAQVTLVDRGRPVEQRVKDVEEFWGHGKLDAVSNVQFGEGGAGTFSDGKLTTRLNHPRRRAVLESLVEFGAPEEILVEARPHVGTDRLRKVIIRFREYLISKGVDLRFETCLTGLDMQRGKVTGGVFDENQLIRCNALILAPGHSARDTYRMLDRSGVQLEPKGFAVGVRTEHPASLINRIQYGKFARQLPAADYTLRYNDDDTGRGVYSFCMCPGGDVINAASEQDGLVVNGMSRMSRSGKYSNSALVVSVRPEDWGGAKLGGIRFQQQWERRAFSMAGKNFLAPAQNLMSFCGLGNGPVSSSCRPGVVETELREVLPDFVYHGIKSALPHFDRKMKGFVTGEAVLIGVETRTSSPLRITRDESGVSVSHAGLFPAGEGAGYAGGIMSAAFDGLRCADQVVQTALRQELS
jgi:uncharacterized FAD-dependent dehydrogenase